MIKMYIANSEGTKYKYVVQGLAGLSHVTHKNTTMSFMSKKYFCFLDRLEKASKRGSVQIALRMPTIGAAVMAAERGWVFTKFFITSIIMNHHESS